MAINTEQNQAPHPHSSLCLHQHTRLSSVFPRKSLALTVDLTMALKVLTWGTWEGLETTKGRREPPTTTNISLAKVIRARAIRVKWAQVRCLEVKCQALIPHSNILHTKTTPG